MRAITVRQPFAWAIAHLGKDVENRGREHPWQSAVGETIAIHAAAAHYGRNYDEAEEVDLDVITTAMCNGYEIGWEIREELEVRSAIVAVAQLEEVHHADLCGSQCSEWAVAREWHLVLTHVQPLPRPVPARGMLGLWSLTEQQQASVRRQVNR